MHPYLGFAMNAGSRWIVRELLAATGLSADAGTPALDEDIESLVCDSRKAGPGSLFVALPGRATAGHLFIADAVARGCRAVAADAALFEAGEIAAEYLPFCIPVPDAHRALHALAGAWYGHPADRMQFIGITGTNGKTTSAWLIEGLLLRAGFRPGVIGTVNYRYHEAEGCRILQNAPLTTPDALTLQALFRQMADAGVTHVVMELSSHALDQGRVGDLLFDVAVFTNLTRDHLDYHKDMASYFAAKSLLFTKHLKPGAAAVIDVDAPGEEEPWGERLAGMAAERGTWVLKSGLAEGCDLRATNPKFGFDGFTCALNACGQTADLHSPLVGTYNVRNVLGAVGAGLALGLPLETVCAGVAAVRAVPGRLERVVPKGDPALFPAVFVDYAHTPDALENVLVTLAAVRGNSGGRIVTVFGCGGDRDPGKRPLMGGVAAKYSDLVVVTSDNPRTEEPEAIIDAIVPGIESLGMRQVEPEALFAGTGRRFARIAARGRAIRLACGLAEPGDIVLIAGKGHEDYQILGTEKRHFDDRVQALDALAAWNARLLVAATGGAVVGATPKPRLLGEVRTDSRALQPGDIFVALEGERFDGHDFIAQAIAAGAGAIIAERFPDDFSEQDGALGIRVPDSLAALGALAHFRRELFADRVKVAAITGSSGKTTVKEMLAAICETALKDDWAHPDPVLKTGGNFNNLIGLPLSLLPLNASHKVAVLEMGMSAPGEIAALTKIADPDVGCVSTVHPAHLQGLGSIEGVARAKGELYHTMRLDAVRVVNEDDPRIWGIAEECPGPKVGFAVTEAGLARKPTVCVSLNSLENLGLGGLHFLLGIDDWEWRIWLSVFGEHNLHNAAAAAALAHALGIAPDKIVAGLEAYRPSIDKRLAVRELSGGLNLINDVYNANPASMSAGLRTLANLAKPPVAAYDSGKTLAVLGDMLELGETSPALHRGIGELAAELHLNWLAVTGEHAPDVAAGARDKGMVPERIHIFENPAAIGPWAAELVRKGELGRGDWIFVKGSRGMRMEGFIEALEAELGAAEEKDVKSAGGGHAV